MGQLNISVQESGGEIPQRAPMAKWWKFKDKTKNHGEKLLWKADFKKFLRLYDFLKHKEVRKIVITSILIKG